MFIIPLNIYFTLHINKLFVCSKTFEQNQHFFNIITIGVR